MEISAMLMMPSVISKKLFTTTSCVCKLPKKWASDMDREVRIVVLALLMAIWVVLRIAKEIEDRHGEGFAHANLGATYRKLVDFKKALEYHQLHHETDCY